MKMDGDPKKKAADEIKIREIWFANYHYQFGATIVLNERECSVSVEQNPRTRSDAKA